MKIRNGVREKSGARGGTVNWRLKKKEINKVKGEAEADPRGEAGRL